MDSGLQAGLVEQGSVQGAAVGMMKRKKLRRNPVRKARLSLKEIHSLVWDTLFSDFDRPWWVHGKVSTGEQGSRKKDSLVAHLRSLLAVPNHPGRLRTACMETADGVQE